MIDMSVGKSSLRRSARSRKARLIEKRVSWYNISSLLFFTPIVIYFCVCNREIVGAIIDSREFVSTVPAQKFAEIQTM